ncbi:MAG: flagellar M-ring protein FliF C-terminal domain-containing protein, partial [Pseudomonadota bacterium]
EVETITEQGPGAIRRLSIAVLLNERMVTAEDGTLTPAPRSQEEVDALEALVLSAAGIDTERGDSLTLRILPFDMPVMEEAATPSFVETYILPQAVHLGQMAFLGIVTLVIALFVVKPLFTSTGTSVATAEIADNTARPMPTDAAGLLAMITEENPDDAAAILDAWFEDEQQPA